MGDDRRRHAPKTGGLLLTYVLWIVQGLLALLFIGLGWMKLSTPVEELVAQMAVPGLLIRFIGVAELLGALGLILPGLFRIRTGLTPLAAAGLAIITAGATVLHLVRGETAMAVFPLVVMLLSAFVAYGRWRLAPLTRPECADDQDRTLSHAR